MRGDRGVGILAPPFLGHIDSGKILHPLNEVDRHVLADPLLERHRKQRAVTAALIPVLQILVRHVQNWGETLEQFLPVLGTAHHLPIESDREQAFVVGQDAAVAVENSPPLGQEFHRTGLVRLDSQFECRSIDGLEEPQSQCQRGHQHRGHQSERGETR